MDMLGSKEGYIMSCSICEGHDTYACPACGPQCEVMICPVCGGTGEGDWQVFDIHTREVINCTEVAYIFAAETEDDAENLGQRYCKESCECQTCKGKGEVYEYHDNYYPIY